jgi:lysophospholipase L1-like esterase
MSHVNIGEPADYQPDRLHPSPASGQEKVARRLLEFLQTNETSKSWFVGK